MASLRDLARRAVSRALGVNADPVQPPEVSFARVSPAVQRVNAERTRPAAASPPAANPPAANPGAGAAPTAAIEPAAGRPAANQAASSHVSDDQLGEALATITCGAQELRERIGAGEPVTVLDVREPFETLAGTLPGAIRIPLGELPARWREVEDANEIVCICASGVRSLEAAKLLRQNGLFNATSLDGGVVAWAAVGGAIVRPGSPAAGRGAGT